MNAKAEGDPENLRTLYNAIVAYHNDLVHMRFTVAGLYLAGSGFLAGAAFSDSDWPYITIVVPILGFAISLIAWLLEIRTYHLLENLCIRGKGIEKKLKISQGDGFFNLMVEQPMGPRVPFSEFRLPPKRIIQYFISHSLGLSLLYSCFGLFWITLLIFR
jgi:hypothetical protein